MLNIHITSEPIAFYRPITVSELFIMNVPVWTEVGNIQNAFSRFGEIINVGFLRDRGIPFIKFADCRIEFNSEADYLHYPRYISHGSKKSISCCRGQNNLNG